VLAYVFAVILSSHRVCQCTGNGEVCRTDFAPCEKVCRRILVKLQKPPYEWQCLLLIGAFTSPELG
jgi:hypothetical protein